MRVVVQLTREGETRKKDKKTDTYREESHKKRGISFPLRVIGRVKN